MGLFKQITPVRAYSHTFQHCRTEHWLPHNINRLTHEVWAQNGAKTYEEVVNAKVRSLLEDHKPKTLTNDIANALETIYQNAEKTLAGKQLPNWPLLCNQESALMDLHSHIRSTIW